MRGIAFAISFAANCDSDDRTHYALNAQANLRSDGDVREQAKNRLRGPSPDVGKATRLKPGQKAAIQAYKVTDRPRGLC
jgi:hypothetical protein